LVISKKQTKVSFFISQNNSQRQTSRVNKNCIISIFISIFAHDKIETQDTKQKGR